MNIKYTWYFYLYGNTIKKDHEPRLGAEPIFSVTIRRRKNLYVDHTGSIEFLKDSDNFQVVEDSFGYTIQEMSVSGKWVNWSLKVVEVDYCEELMSWGVSSDEECMDLPSC